MKNKKGFTLIELLAVIVILAIIALIAVPIVLNMISQARKSAARSAALGYIDAIEYNNGFAEVEQEGYTSITGEKEVSEIDVKMKGKKPDSGSVTISNEGKVTHAEICINGYNVEYNGKDAAVGDKCSGSSSIPNPVSFATDSWATINKAVKNNNTSVYNVGDTKTIEMDVNDDGVNETYHLRLVNKSTPDVCNTTGYSQTACGFVIEFVEIVNIQNVIFDSNDENENTGGWAATGMRRYLNNEFYNIIPNDLKKIIIETDPIVSGSGSSGISPNVSDKIYFFSTREVGWDFPHDNKKNIETDTRILDYYEANNNNTSRIKKDLNNVAKTWWLRSAWAGYKNGYAYIRTDGTCNAILATLNPQGVSPAFRIGK